MALDQSDRGQLLKARENIGAQLEQLERDGNSFMQPDCRDVYAELQRQLHEIDSLLEEHGGASDDAASAYRPMVNWYRDGIVGNPVRETRPGRVLALIAVAFLLLCLGMSLWNFLAQ